MNAKPLPQQKAKALTDSFQRHSKELEIYEATVLAQAQLKQLLKQPNVWICVGKSKWN